MINTENINISYCAIIPLSGHNNAEALKYDVFKTDDKKAVQTLLAGIKQPLFYHFENEDNNFQPLLRDLFMLDENAHIHFPDIINRYFQYFPAQENKQIYWLTLHVQDLLIEDELCSGIIMLVLDEKDDFFNIENSENKLSLKLKEGFSPNAISKLALVLQADDISYKVLLPEAKLKGFEGRTWKDDFLQLKMTQDDFSYTTDYIKLTSKFIKDRVPIEEVLGKQKEVEMLNKTNDYFRENDVFEEETFKKKVFNNNELIEAFDDYKVKWQEKNNKQLNREFEVSDEAWLSNQKVFKSVIKLDKNFHVYVHGDHKKIVKGEDEDGRKYYKLYYENES